MKSFRDCLNHIDSMIKFDHGRFIGIGNLEEIRDYMLKTYSNEYIEHIVVMNNLLSQINLMIEKFYIDDNLNVKKEYSILRQHILAWLREKYAKLEVNDDDDGGE